MRWLNAALFETDEEFDFGVESLDTMMLPKQDPDDDQEEPGYESIVTLRRVAGVRFPATVRVTFSDDSVREFLW